MRSGSRLVGREMEFTLSRRRLLAACAVSATAGLAGCVDPDVAMFVDRVSTDREIAEQATVRLSQESEHRSLVANVTDGDTNTTVEAPSGTASNHPPFQPDRPVVYDGAVYDFEWESTGRTESHTEYRLLLTAYDDGRETDIAFEDLPEIDQDRIGRFREFLDWAESEPEDDEQRSQLEFQYRYTTAEREASVLVPDPEYEVIDIDGRPVGVTVRSTTVDREVYRYNATERAPTLAAFGQDLQEAHQFVLTGLSAAERDFFESVVDEGSYYQGSLSNDQDDAFEGVADVFVDQPALFVEYTEGEWLVRYDNTDYWVRIDFVRMEAYADRLQVVDSL